MKVIYGIGKVKETVKNAVIAIGVFDGVHLGHQALIQKAIARAKAIKGKVVVMTFFPHPVAVLNPERYLPLIVSLPYRIKLLEHLGVAVCIVAHFTKKFSQITPKEFIQRYFIKGIFPREIFVGDDFRFGKHREGRIQDFCAFGKKYGFQVNAMKCIGGKKKKIGSTRIRELIAAGKLKYVSKLLGRNVSIMGTVVRGKSLGKELGYPTANLNPDGEVILPFGVYAVRVMVGRTMYDGMANIGLRPSFKESDRNVNIEVHIFDYHKNLYGREIIVEFLKKIRKERAFCSKEALVKRLKCDEVEIRGVLIENRNFLP